MASGAQQLTADFEQVQKMLERYPDIKIIRTDGDPPDQYDIEYTIKGYRTNSDGTASPDNKHQVHITLPFGYPHFPPTAKPITPIFHPDIDPDAIRIADFWQENHSLADLIIHIGKMICGNHYTKEEPFNQNAFDWFEERKSWLPFDLLEPRDEEEEMTEASPTQAEPEHAFVPAADLDILKDDIDFSFDEDEESGESGDEISFDIEEDSGDDLTFDTGEDNATEPFDFQDSGDDEIDDLFGLEADEIQDDISFDLADESEAEEPGDVASSTEDLFDLDTEEPPADTAAETKTEFDSTDMSSAFEEESFTEPEEADSVDILLDDLAGLEKEETALDFDMTEESMSMDSEETVDLSGLEAEDDKAANEDETAEAAETAGDEEKILSALSLDEDFASIGKPAENSTLIRSLIDQKQIYSAKKALAELHDPDSLPDRKELELTITDAIGEAEELYKKADKHEQKGELEKAGIILDLVANIAIDFPGLDFSRNRIRESMMAGGMKKSDRTADEKVTEQTPAGKPGAAAEKDSGTIKKKRRRPRSKVPARLVVTLILAFLLCGIGAGAVYIYQSGSRNVQLAGNSLQHAEQLVNRKEFKNAQKELDAARSALENVIIFHGTKKDTITDRIQEIAGSSIFKEGLQGRVLYGDQYVSVETAKAIDQFNIHKDQAEGLLKAGNPGQAVIAYEKSLPYADKAGFTEQANTISRRVHELRLEISLSQAQQFEDKQDWLNAEKAYLSALELSKNISSPEKQSAIADRLAVSSYRYNHQEGLKAINNSKWQESINAFQNALTVLDAHPHIVPENEKTEIRKLLIQSHLYFRLAAAKKAYENKEWDIALETYNDAVALLEKNRGILGQEGENNIQKIKKTILTTHVAREQAGVAANRAEAALDKTVEHYQTIVDLIENSPFTDDETLAAILDDARTQTTEIKNQLLISQKEKWLLDNYEEIFRDNYPSARSSELRNPKVRFIKRDDDIMFFNLSCRELKQGSFFRLELYYQHDLSKDKWELYSGKIEDMQPE
ncbi:MAG: hypothetical protein M8357_01150 [Desulfobulbaceae bacterium]|nr:hypothetical protein [Desulfobulbaceae bacterium]